MGLSRNYQASVIQGEGTQRSREPSTPQKKTPGQSTGPHGKPASHKLGFQGPLPALQPRGAQRLGAQLSTQITQSTEGSLSAGPVSGRDAGRVEHTQLSAGVILDALSLLPRATPQPGPD